MVDYFLRTERVGFRQWTERDLELALELWSDPQVTIYLGGPLDEARVRERLERELSNARTYGIQYWPIFVLASGDHIGCCGLKPYRLEQGIYEHGFHLLPAFWGQGFASEAGRAAVDYAFRVIGAKSLFAGRHPENDASRRVLEKLGFQYAYDEFFPPTGLHHPSYLLSAEEYFQRSAAER